MMRIRTVLAGIAFGAALLTSADLPAQSNGFDLPVNVGTRWGDGWEIYVWNPTDKTAVAVRLTIHQTHPGTGNQFVANVIWLGNIPPGGTTMAKFNCPVDCWQFLATARAQEMW